MDSAEYQNLRNRIQALRDAEVLSIVTVRQTESRPEAVEIARAECRNRGITAKDIEQFPRAFAQALRESLGFAKGASTQPPMSLLDPPSPSTCSLVRVSTTRLTSARSVARSARPNGSGFCCRCGS